MTDSVTPFTKTTFFPHSLKMPEVRWAGHLLNGVKSVKRLGIQELRVTGLPGSVRQIRVKIEVHAASEAPQTDRKLRNPLNVKLTDARARAATIHLSKGKEWSCVTSRRPNRTHAFEHFGRTAVPITSEKRHSRFLKYHQEQVRVLAWQKENPNRSRPVIPTQVRTDLNDRTWQTHSPLHINRHSDTVSGLNASAVISKWTRLTRVNQRHDVLAIFSLISAPRAAGTAIEPESRIRDATKTARRGFASDRGL